MSKTPTSSASNTPGLADDGGMDWGNFDALTDADIATAVAADPDARPVEEPLSSNARRIGLEGSLRFRLQLSLEEFEARYRIPADTLFAWERGTARPDLAMLAYLTLIAADPDGVAATLTQTRAAVAAE